MKKAILYYPCQYWQPAQGGVMANVKLQYKETPQLRGGFTDSDDRTITALTSYAHPIYQLREPNSFISINLLKSDNKNVSLFEINFSVCLLNLPKFSECKI